jgi:anti-sigma factor RsiW
MNCRQVENRLMDYLEGTLAARERELIDLHARSCVLCAERIQGFPEVFGLLDSWKDIEPSPSFNARLEQRLEREAASRNWLGNLFPRLAALRFGYPAFALALMLAVSIGAIVVKYSPSQTQTVASRQQAPLMASASAADDDLTLYRNLPVLEDLDVLRNFEVLQELDGAAASKQ